MAKTATPRPIEDLSVYGFFTALVCPIVGLIIGTILMAKEYVGRGVAIAVLSVVASVGWVVIGLQIAGDDPASAEDDGAFIDACLTPPSERTQDQVELLDSSAESCP